MSATVASQITRIEPPAANIAAANTSLTGLSSADVAVLVSRGGAYRVMFVQNFDNLNGDQKGGDGIEKVLVQGV